MSCVMWSPSFWPGPRAVVVVVGDNPIQSNSESKSESKSKLAQENLCELHFLYLLTPFTQLLQLPSTKYGGTESESLSTMVAVAASQNNVTVTAFSSPMPSPSPFSVISHFIYTNDAISKEKMESHHHDSSHDKYIHFCCQIPFVRESKSERRQSSSVFLSQSVQSTYL